MLNSKSERELCYVVTIDELRPIEGYDRVEHARVGGWWVIVRKDQFKVGDPAIYFEIDSRVPATEPFAFMEKRGYKVKTLKMCKVLSQGLLMSAEDFGWQAAGEGIIDNNGVGHRVDNETRFLTKELGVIYADAEDNKRKAASVDKYKKMATRHPKIFKQAWARWLMRREWGKRLLFVFFGKKRDKKGGWPDWVTKTDEERVQNMPWIVNDKSPWVATEKIDGTSTTFTMLRKHTIFGYKYEFYVCSRNVCFDSVEKPCYYDTNVYWEMAKKYDMYNVLHTILERHPHWYFVTIQGETYGAGIQKRDYSLKEHEFAAFNFITSDVGRWSTWEMKAMLEAYGVPCVPVLNLKYVLPDTVDELLVAAEGKSKIDGKPREGIVFRSQDGARSFKAVSNSFLMKYHG